MVGTRGTLLSGLFNRELLGGCTGPSLPAGFLQAFTTSAPCAGVIRVDPDGEPCPPYSITYNQVAHGCRFLTVGDEEGCVSIVDTSEDTLPASLYTDAARPPRAKWLAHNNTIFDLAWAKHDSLLLTASGDQHVGVWDAAVGRLRVYCAGHDGSVKAVAPHGSQPDVFASGSRDGGILLWDMRTPSRWSAAKRRMQLAPVLRIDIGALPARLCGGTSAAQGGGAAGAGGAAAPGSAGRRSARRGGSSAGSPWASGGSGAAAGCRRSVTSLLFLHNEHSLISSSDMDGIVKLWDLRNATSSVRDVTFPSAAAAAADDRARGRSSRGRRSSGAAAGNGIGDKCSSGSSSSSDMCWLGLTCPSRSSRPAGITSMAISPAGDLLLVSSVDSVHYVYRLATLDGPPIATLAGHRSDSFCVKACFSPDGRRVLSGSSDRHAYIWDLTQPRLPPVALRGHSGEVTAVAWCPSDEGQIVTAADDATLRVWALDRADMRCMQNYEQNNVADIAPILRGGPWDHLRLAGVPSVPASSAPAPSTALAAGSARTGGRAGSCVMGTPRTFAHGTSACSPASPQPLSRQPSGTSGAHCGAVVTAAGVAGCGGSTDGVGVHTPAAQRCLQGPASWGTSPAAGSAPHSAPPRRSAPRLTQLLITQQLASAQRAAAGAAAQPQCPASDSKAAATPPLRRVELGSPWKLPQPVHCQHQAEAAGLEEEVRAQRCLQQQHDHQQQQQQQPREQQKLEQQKQEQQHLPLPAARLLQDDFEVLADAPRTQAAACSSIMPPQLHDAQQVDESGRQLQLQQHDPLVTADDTGRQALLQLQAGQRAPLHELLLPALARDSAGKAAVRTMSGGSPAAINHAPGSSPGLPPCASRRAGMCLDSSSQGRALDLDLVAQPAGASAVACASPLLQLPAPGLQHAAAQHAPSQQRQGVAAAGSACPRRGSRLRDGAGAQPVPQPHHQPLQDAVGMMPDALPTFGRGATARRDSVPRKRQCTLSLVWASVQDVEDGSSRFSGY